MGTAKCNNCARAKKYSYFSVRVVEDSPDINYFEFEPTECPLCGSDDTEFVDYDDEV